MNIEQLREIIRNVRIQNTLLYGETIVVHGLSQEQLAEILLLAQSRLLELENKRVRDNPLNPS